MKLILSVTCLLLVGLVEARADEEPIFSGPQPGEKLPPLKVRNVLAEEATDVSLIEKAAGKPVLLVFFHKRTRPAFGLTNALVRLAKTREKQGLVSGVIMLTDDPTETGNWMKRIRHLLTQDTLYGISMDGAEGPGAYGLNREVTLTVLVGKEGQVTANFALVQPSLPNDGPKIAKAVVDVTGGGKVPDILSLLGTRMQNQNKRPAQRPQRKPLPGMLRRLINKEASEEDVSSAAKDIEEFIAKEGNEEWKKRVGQITTNIISAGKLENYGTEPAREQLKQWAEKYGPKKRPSGRDAPEKGERSKPENEKANESSDKDTEAKKKDTE